MRQLWVLIASAVLLLGCGQTSRNNEATSSNDRAIQEADSTNKTIKLSAHPKTLKVSALPDSITVKMTNNTIDTVTTGLHYCIEKFGANGWKEASPKDILFHDLGWQLKPNDTEFFRKKLYKDQIHYTVGKYRIVKHYLKSNYQQTRESFNVFAEFNVEE